jgi:prevent-host-death family protein
LIFEEEVVMAAYNLYEAKTSLSQLVERAAKGEEIVIAKAGKPMVKMVPVVEKSKTKKRDWGNNPMGITYIAPDFDDPVWTDEELEEFGF